MRNKAIRIVLLVLAVVLFTLLIPQVTSRYDISIMNTAVIYFIGALGISLMLGMTGLLAFSTIAFMGVGAMFTVQFSKKISMAPAMSLVLSIICTAAFAFIIGLALLRLKGSYFTFATIGLLQIISSFLQNWRPLMGGPDGTSGIPTLSLGPLAPSNSYEWFYILMFFAILCGLLLERIRRSYLGRALASVRDNEIAAKTLGVNVYMTKVIAFTIAGAFAGLSGALYAHYSSFVSQSLFTFDTSCNMLVMVMLGGVNSTVGTFLGSILVTMLPEWLRVLTFYLKLIFGVSIILLMVFMPMGITGLIKAFFARLRMRYKKMEKDA